ncbi:Mucolipidin protein, partial [Globisporangium splendens]
MAPAASPPSSRRHLWLLSVRLALHVGVIVALTLRSAHIGNALHPFTRALANEWIHLLFYVDTIKKIPIWTTTTQQQSEIPQFTEVPVTLPHFLLEIEEEIAANVDDEFFSGGFAARASSYPVGMLFTIDETKQHLHGAIANYFRLADVALDTYLLAGSDDPLAAMIPFPELVVRYEKGMETVDERFVITGKNESEWPEPLQCSHTSAQTRAFFARLDAMQLQFTVGMKTQDAAAAVGDGDDIGDNKLLEWRVVFTYDLQSQGHLEVALDYGLRQATVDANGKKQPLDEDHLPKVFTDRNALFDACLLALVYVYQCVEFAIKWLYSRTTTRKARHVCIVLSDVAKDFWFWFILALNGATMACFIEAWRHPFRLSLHDELCLAFAACCALQWVSLVRYLRVNTRFHILGLTLQRGLPRVAQFLAGVLPIFVGYVLFGTIMFGAKVPRFQSASATATTLFSVANGDEIHDTFNSVTYTPWIGQIYVYSYMILFSYAVLMVCIGIIEDAFFSAVFPASWPSLGQQEREQAQRKQQRQHQRQKTRDQRHDTNVREYSLYNGDEEEEAALRSSRV